MFFWYTRNLVLIVCLILPAIVAAQSFEEGTWATDSTLDYACQLQLDALSGESVSGIVFQIIDGSPSFVDIEALEKSTKKSRRRAKRRSRRLRTQIRAAESRAQRKKFRTKRKKRQEQFKMANAELGFFEGCKLAELTPDTEEDDSEDEMTTPSPSPSPSPNPGPGDGDSELAPEAPINTRGVAGDEENIISWDSAIGAESYDLYWSENSFTDLNSATKIPDVTSAFTHSNLINGRSYFYRITASNQIGESSPSSLFTVSPSNEFTRFLPNWANLPAQRVLHFDYDSQKSSAENGSLLKDTIDGLVPGDELQVGSGTYDMGLFNWELDISGTQSAPIRVVAQEGASPKLVRYVTNKNNLELGKNNSRFLIIEGFEFIGGSAGIRIYTVQDFVLLNNYIHHTADAGLTANTRDTERLYLVGNEIAYTAGYGEGMYLGANNSAVRMGNSVIAANYVHHMREGFQGDGIEVKQGSYGNWIVANVIHTTRYPALTVYGTDGLAPNIIEENFLADSLDNTLQVKGEAIVRNNIVTNTDGYSAFNSRDIQGVATEIVVQHNTFVDSAGGTAVYLGDWSNKSGMQFTNNAVYSNGGIALRFADGRTGATVEGNVIFGSVSGSSSGYVSSEGLSDFVNISWSSLLTAEPLDFSPARFQGLIAAGDPTYQTQTDFFQKNVIGSIEAGAIDF